MCLSSYCPIDLNTEYKYFINNVHMEAEVLKTQSGKLNSLLPAPRSKNIKGIFMTYLPSVVISISLRYKTSFLFHNSIFHLSDINNNMDCWILFHCLQIVFCYAQFSNAGVRGMYINIWCQYNIIDGS